MSNKKILLYIIGIIAIVLGAVVAKVFFNIKGFKVAIIFSILLIIWHGLFQKELLKIGKAK
ncbi:hypothetical protein [Anaerocellum danielii]|uniref:Uncharacterized protein n=1 Tax=Anaerocellum danielii TaxID=1387557 RepID=A0ABZ0U0U7_9FIRM|nr:hypothetical protein [Caldicellulosiruptor danielii]WPX08717.1 hypothetical protein SOJ16_002626 [Caldicellulosiruptor danielii]